MRLAWFTHRYFPAIGGAETYGREMVRRFLAAGHEVDVVTSDALDLWYFTDPAARRVEAPRLSELDGARVLRFPVRHVPLQRYLGRLLSYAPHWPTRCRFESFMPIIPGIERVRGAYDAVFGVGFPYTIFSLAGLRTARAAGAPLVLTPFLHLATQGDPVNRLYSRAHQARLLAQSQTVVVQTELENLAVVSLGIPRSRVFTLGMGVDQAEVTGGDRLRLRSRLGIPAECAVIGQLGVNDPNKGTNDLVNAVACLNARRPDDDQIHLILGGASTPAFQSFAAALPGACQRWLHMLGPVTPRDRPNFYSALDVFAMPSRTDSHGIVFLEAWANGLPVVGAAAGGVREVIAHGKTGLLVPFGQVELLADALHSLLSDPALARRLGQAGKEQVSRGHSWDDRFSALSARVRELVGPRLAHSA